MTVATVPHINEQRNNKLGYDLNKSFVAPIAKYSGDSESPSKRLAAFFALRHADDFRHSQKLDHWLYWDATLSRWRICKDEHTRAAESLLAEASKVMWRLGSVNSKAMAREILRLAEMEAGMRRPVALRDCEDGLARLLEMRGRT